MNLESLRTHWLELMKKSLPNAAKSHKEWPIRLDHCFGRVILDNVVGVDRPWTQKIKSPAYKNMTKEQLEQAIELALQILNGTADLNELNINSLKLRGKYS